MRIIILAGGLGTRIRPMFPLVPKCLIKLGNIPFIEFQISNLLELGFNEIILSLGHRSEMVEEWVNNSKLKSIIKTCVETEQIGTLGAIKYAFLKHKLTDSYVLNGDTYFNINKSELLKISYDKINLWGINVQDSSQFGTIKVKNDKIIAFHEKKCTGPGIVNSGLYYIRSVDLDLIGDDKGSFETIAIPKLHKLNRLQFKLLNTCQLFDIGTPDGFNKLNTVVNSKLSK